MSHIRLRYELRKTEYLPSHVEIEQYIQENQLGTVRFGGRVVYAGHGAGKGVDQSVVIPSMYR